VERQGKIANVPYDTRRPTVARFKSTYWSSENTRFFPPKVMGLGWGINFYWVVHPFRWMSARRASRNAPAESRVHET
jgi:hypothetical protein